jgi:hypothetical protein
MFFQRAFLVSMMLSVGCAANTPDTDTRTSRLPPGEAPADQPASADSEPSMMDLRMPFEVLGAPQAGLTACVRFYFSANPGQSAHAPAFIAPDAGSACTQQDDGMLQIRLPAQTHALVSLSGPEVSPLLVQVTTGAEPHAMLPVRLLSDLAIASVSSGIQGPSAIEVRTAVVETPADGITSTLFINGTDMMMTPVYLDAAGQPVDGDRSVAGGWAVFAGLPKGAHEVTMAHDKLACVPHASATWGATRTGAITVLADEGLGASSPNPIAHSNAFRCH